MGYHVYVIESHTTARRYIGITSDLARRLNDHNRGKSFSVRGRGPFRLLWSEAHLSRADAMKREKQLKRFKGGEALRRLLRERGAH